MVLGHGKELVHGNLNLCVLDNYKGYYNEPNVPVRVAAVRSSNGYRPWGAAERFDLVLGGLAPHRRRAACLFLSESLENSLY